MNILFLGDIIGEPGRKAVAKILPELAASYHVEMVIANGENSAGGFGITPKIAEEIFSYGVDVITLGNHAWDRKEVSQIIEDNHLLRAANYPPGVPGRGYNIYTTANGYKIGVLVLMGRVYMPILDCPFRCADAAIQQMSASTSLIVVDVHAEITSEKQALGWYLDGRVSAVIGTHTHVPTADARILTAGTGFITDCGMIGPRDSIIGVGKEIALKKFLTGLPHKFNIENKTVVFSSVLLDINEKTGKADSIQRLERIVEIAKP
ncbi:MAG: TIGR00282 family metallophosphoesterase [Elusimicrobiota bacterium]